jgi:potassium-dependent mechanosensitive channel
MLPSRRCTVACLVLGLLLGHPLNLPAQAPPVAAPPGPQSNQPPPADAEKQAAEWREKREQAQAALNAAGAPANAASEATREELQERRSLLEQIVRVYDQQLGDLQRLAEARERHADIVRTSNEWKGFPEPPPYTVFLADQLWDAAYSLRLATEGLQSQLELLTLRFERAREALAAAEERLRQAAERLEAVKDSAQAGRERWLRDLAALRVQAASVAVGAAQLSNTRVEEELADTKARLAFEQRRLEAVAPHVIFSEAELDKVRARLTEERQRLEEELEQTLAERRRQSAAMQEAERRLESLRSKRPVRKTPAAETAAMARANAAVELARARMDNLVLQGDLLQQLIDVVEGERQLWESRFVITHTAEPGQARDAYHRFTPLFGNFRAARDYLRQQAGIVAEQISELENRLRVASRPRQREPLQQLVQAFHEREDAYTRALRRVDEAARFMERWRTEFKERQKELPLSAHFDDWLARAAGLIQDVWSYEVFSAEDTIEVEGKKITGRRSVTVGKIVTALGILVIGYACCLYLARLIGRLAVTRLGMAPEVANLIRQWSQAFLVTILIVVSFMWVKIPLTIFAFFGGAFAIGVGFGAQTLLKSSAASSC